MIQLNPTELAFVQLLSSGVAIAQIAKKYRCQRKTVTRYLLNVRKKLNIEDNSQLVVAYLTNKEKFTN